MRKYISSNVRCLVPETRNCRFICCSLKCYENFKSRKSCRHCKYSLKGTCAVTAWNAKALQASPLWEADKKVYAYSRDEGDILSNVGEYCIFISLSSTPIWQQKGGAPVEKVCYFLYLLCCGRHSELLCLQMARQSPRWQLACCVIHSENPRGSSSGVFNLCSVELVISFVECIIYHIRLLVKYSRAYDNTNRTTKRFRLFRTLGAESSQCPKGKTGRHSAPNEKIYIKQCVLLNTHKRY